jgi:hypothetical protein
VWSQRDHFDVRAQCLEEMSCHGLGAAENVGLHVDDESHCSGHLQWRPLREHLGILRTHDVHHGDVANVTASDGAPRVADRRSSDA